MSETQELGAGELATDGVVVRTLAEADLDAIVRIDASAFGRARREYYRDKVSASLRDSRVHMSLVAELDGLVVGFLMAQTHYGEFGRAEPAAVIDSLGVHKDFQKRHVGAALMRQFLMNVRALGVERVRTEVAWNDLDLVRFFDHAGFKPGSRIVLEREIEPST
jgi:ribosomal protein S18 acetylase RimI-like enzyme